MLYSSTCQHSKIANTPKKIPLIFNTRTILPGYTLQIGILLVPEKSAKIRYILAKS